MGTIQGFIRRDFLVWSSYRLQAIREFGGLVAAVVFLFGLEKVIGSIHLAFLDRYNTDYVGYLMVSITFVEIWGVGFLLSSKLRESQSLGTLEAMMLAPIGLLRILIYGTIFQSMIILARLLLFVVVAVVLFGLWQHANLLSVAAIFLVSLLTMGCIGVLSAAFVMLLKQGDPIIPLYGLLNGLFSGAIFPPDVLPVWLQPLSRVLPLTYALDGMRQALNGASVFQVSQQIVLLLLIFLVLFPLTAWTLRWATRRAKMEGSLVQY